MCKTFLAQAVPCTNCSVCRTAGFGWSVPTLQHAGCFVLGTAHKGTVLIQAQMFHRGREQEKSQGYCQLRWEGRCQEDWGLACRGYCMLYWNITCGERRKGAGRWAIRKLLLRVSLMKMGVSCLFGFCFIQTLKQQKYSRFCGMEVDPNSRMQWNYSKMETKHFSHFMQACINDQS